MKLLLILAAILASRCNVFPEYARMDIVHVPGVSGTIEQYCANQRDGTYVYSMTAVTETPMPRRYNLDLPLSTGSGNPSVMPSTDASIDGGIVTWREHKAGETLTIEVSGLGCRCGVPRLRSYFPLYIPGIYKE